MSASAKLVPSPDFRTLFESMPAMYAVLGPDLRIIAATDAYVKTTGSQRSEILGRDICEIAPQISGKENGEDARRLRGSLQRVLRGRFPDVLLLADWNVHNVPVLSRDGEVVYVIHRLCDSTEAREPRLNGPQRADAEKWAWDRTDAPEGARSLNAIAHDLNNALGIILACEQMLQDRCANSEEVTQRLVAQMKQATDKAVSLTRELLAYNSKR